MKKKFEKKEYSLGGWFKKNMTSNQGDAHPDAGKPTSESSDFGKWLRGSNGPDGKSAGKMIGNLYNLGSQAFDMVMPGTGQLMRSVGSLSEEDPTTMYPRYSNQPMTNNPFLPTFEGGGKTSSSTSVVTNNLWTPETRKSIYPYLAQKGLLGHGADSVTMDQWNRLTPNQTLQYVKPDQGVDYTIGNTANPGGIKYWSLDKVPAVNGPSIRGSNFSGNYLDAKKKTKYADGGVMPYAEPNIEAEGGEVSQGPDGSMVGIQGPSHAQGGVDLAAQPGTRIYSDKLKASTGKTFAEEADMIRKQMAKYEKMLS